MKTSELTGAALDWAVAVCEHNVGWEPEGEDRDYYSTDWAQGGPIIEREHTEFDFDEDTQMFHAYDGVYAGVGPTHLIAAMRCYVASKLGDTVEIPEELK
jgi:hypothetical protein